MKLESTDPGQRKMDEGDGSSARDAAAVSKNKKKHKFTVGFVSQQPKGEFFANLHCHRQSRRLGD